ncbi:hypothetical protein N9C66_08680 [Akkermansiaceae bacterium]|nr:hypothetical protein [Akkermansiaceae bacterium]MDB4370050.1 hypothetical protein [Akkermansiaceae bacterium]MDB4566932.1 hypothetical protein [Akkermansiaceae bacterium]
MKLSALIATFILGVGFGALLLPTLSSTRCQLRDSSQGQETNEVTLSLLGSITGKKFPLKKVISETSGAMILEPNNSHQPLLELIHSLTMEVSAKFSEPNSPAHEKRRINEVSALFEDALRIKIDAHPDFACDFPKTQAGEVQRSGYPDLRVEHLPTGAVAYLDPKLFEETSIKSSFRTFYFEPSPENAKVTEDALHLLIGFPHDGKTQKWTFGKPHLVDLSRLTVKLKTEFSASNRDLYQEANPD